jgi:hypothetical protein
MSDQSEDMNRQFMVDGNAVAGLLQDVFGLEMTASPAASAHCGQVNELGALLAFMTAPRRSPCAGVYSWSTTFAGLFLGDHANGFELEFPAIRLHFRVCPRVCSQNSKSILLKKRLPFIRFIQRKSRFNKWHLQHGFCWSKPGMELAVGLQDAPYFAQVLFRMVPEINHHIRIDDIERLVLERQVVAVAFPQC